MDLRLAGLLLSSLLVMQPALATEVAIARCAYTGVIGVGQGPNQRMAANWAHQDCINRGGDPRCCAGRIVTSEDMPCVAWAWIEGSLEVGVGGVGDSAREAVQNALGRCGPFCDRTPGFCRQ
jgi:hypothetical protein